MIKQMTEAFMDEIYEIKRDWNTGRIDDPAEVNRLLEDEYDTLNDGFYALTRYGIVEYEEVEKAQAECFAYMMRKKII